ncbi:hypothetical protein LOK49_LG12G00309 [Camellia lanceoleosa]|uniref:Uncharacterized protein n=1 Tax=Camellia lanceoleosa TaxID=1840588 RepID=A0ACC0FS65_9ERIC|nr:hypothetical protein LOK49_LG12G00309 [Camellia lanceoleosa]
MRSSATSREFQNHSLLIFIRSCLSSGRESCKVSLLFEVSLAGWFVSFLVLLEGLSLMVKKRFLLKSIPIIKRLSSTEKAIDEDIGMNDNAFSKFPPRFPSNFPIKCGIGVDFSKEGPSGSTRPYKYNGSGVGGDTSGATLKKPLKRRKRDLLLRSRLKLGFSSLSSWQEQREHHGPSLTMNKAKMSHTTSLDSQALNLFCSTQMEDYDRVTNPPSALSVEEEAHEEIEEEA